MAVHVMLAVYDVVGATYDRPFAVPSVAVGVRSFQNALKDPQAQISKNPSDYALYEIGAYDDQSGELISKPPQQVFRAAVGE